MDELHENKPYDETVDVPDSEDIITPRVPTQARLAQLQQGNPSKTPEKTMSVASDDSKSQTAEPVVAGRPSRPVQPLPATTQFEEEGDEEETGGSSDDEDDDEDDDDEDDANPTVEGAYNPADFENLNISKEIKELFQYIQRYTPQTIELEHRLKPFIPDYIPAVGDIDAFLKVPRPDLKSDGLGLVVLDEPCANQSDPTVLDLQLRAVSKQSTNKQMAFRSLEEADKKPREIDNWIKSITDLHRTKPPASVHYNKNMPDIESLMQEWPPEFEELLKETALPGSDLDCDLSTYVDVICSILDIPVYTNRIHSLHVLFTLFSEFRNSQHFTSMEHA